MMGLEISALLWYNNCSKKPPRVGACGSREVGENMEFGLRPQSWPFTGLDYVGIMDFVARKSTVFGRKITKKHVKWGKKPSFFIWTEWRRWEPASSLLHTKLIKESNMHARHDRERCVWLSQSATRVFDRFRILSLRPENPYGAQRPIGIFRLNATR